MRAMSRHSVPQNPRRAMIASIGAVLLRLLCALLFFAALPLTSPSRSQRISLFPKLHRGQVLAYHVSYHADKDVQTQSSFITSMPGDSAKTDVHALLRLEVLDVTPYGERARIHARTRFDILDSALPLQTPSLDTPAPQGQSGDSDYKWVEFTLLPDGQIDAVKGLDTLSPEQQQAWQEWSSRFALPDMFPVAGVRVSQKWKSDALETSPSPIARLHWIRQSTYVRNEPCGPMTLAPDGQLATSDAARETCAVILTTATLKQQSSPANATPEAFRVRELRTTGSAHGKNRIITYISLKTGLIVRSTEEANQNMDVTVAKADRSNRVHYSVAAKSRSEVLLVSESATGNP